MVRNARGGGGGGLADARKTRRKESERTHAISFTRVEQPLKSPVFDHEKEGKRKI